MAKKTQNPVIAITLRIETQADLDRIAEGNRLRKAQVDRDVASTRARGSVARERILELPNGAAKLAAIDNIRAGTPDKKVRDLGDQMDKAVQSATMECEKYMLNNAQCLGTAMHLSTPFLAELQKLATEALTGCVKPFVVDSWGDEPQGKTINYDDKNLLTSVIVYTTSRPGVRWVIGASEDFDDVAFKLRTDVHCDLVVEPYAKKLEMYRFMGGRDCLADMRKQLEDERDSDGPRCCSLPSVGFLFPIAFGNEIVFLKFCYNHAFAMIEKYKIQIREAGVQEPWEGVGNWW